MTTDKFWSLWMVALGSSVNNVPDDIAVDPTFQYLEFESNSTDSDPPYA